MNTLDEFRCTIHNLVFGCRQPEKGDQVVMRCPQCANIEISALREQNKKLTDQRDALLKAIEIKRTVIPL